MLWRLMRLGLRGGRRTVASGLRAMFRILLLRTFLILLALIVVLIRCASIEALRNLYRGLSALATSRRARRVGVWRTWLMRKLVVLIGRLWRWSRW